MGWGGRSLVEELRFPSALISSVWFSSSVISNSYLPHGPQNARSPCPSPTPRVHSLMSIKPVMPSSHLILCRPLLLLPPVFPSTRVFSGESALSIRWPKDWSFSLSISSSNEYSGLISLRMDWLDLLAVQGTLESSPTPHSHTHIHTHTNAYIHIHIYKCTQASVH